MRRLNILLIPTICFLLTACPFGKGDPTDYRGTPKQKVQVTSPNGVSLRSGTAIPASTVSAAERGLDKAFAIAEGEPNKYSGFRKHAAYTIWLWPRSSKCDNPAIYRHFNTDSNGYDGTPYDKDPKKGKVGLCFAGISKPLGIGGSPNVQPQMIIVDDAGTIETVTWYEAEHNILFEVDPMRYAATSSIDHFHPILGEGPPSGSFAVWTFEVPFDVEFEGMQLTKGDILHGLLTK